MSKMENEIKDHIEEIKKEKDSFIVFLLVFLVLAFVWTMVISPENANAATLEANEGTSIDTENYGTDGAKGQSFEHSTDFDLNSVEIWGGVGNSPATSVTLEVYDGNGTGGTLVCSEPAFDVTGWPNWSSADWQTITISGCSGLLANNPYTFVVVSDDGSGSDAVRWATSDTSYGDGEEYYDGTARPTRDAMFRIIGDEVIGSSTSTSTEGTTTVEALWAINSSIMIGWAILLGIISAIMMVWLFRIT